MAEQGPLSGQTIGEKYQLGEGGFGAVYKATHLQLHRQQAIKVLLEQHFRKKDFRDRFFREAQTIAALDHPYIIHLDDFWVEPSRAYLVMPFISGGTLQDILRKQPGFLKLEQIASYLEYICTALDYAHGRGVAHLDLKPLNLLVHEDGRLLLSDFGLAHLMKQGAIEGGSSLRFGTPHYMAPEHIQGRPERQSDLFSLGVMLYQMLVGRRPFEGLVPEAVMMKNITEWPPSPRALRPELPQTVENVLGRALAKLPEQRYQTANELSKAFKEAIAPLIPQAKAAVALPPPSSLFIDEDNLPAWMKKAPEEMKAAVTPLPPSSPLIDENNLPAWMKETPEVKKAAVVPPPINEDELPAWLQSLRQVERPSPPGISNSIGCLRIEKGKEPGRVYEIRKESFSIGRSRESDLFLEDLVLSRLHASIVSLGKGNYALREEGSANGTKLNGQWVNRYQPQPLQSGDRIEFGNSDKTLLRFFK